MLTKEQLLENQSDLEEQLEKSTRDCIALNGALQNCIFLLELCKEPDAEPEEEPSETNPE